MHVYTVIKIKPQTDRLAVKIGKTDTPASRLAALNTSSEEKLFMTACEAFRFPGFVEKMLHLKWDKYRANGEWFLLNSDQIRELYEDMGKLGAVHCHCSKQCRSGGERGKCLQKNCKYA